MIANSVVAEDLPCNFYETQSRSQIAITVAAAAVPLLNGDWISRQRVLSGHTNELSTAIKFRQIMQTRSGEEERMDGCRMGGRTLLVLGILLSGGACGTRERREASAPDSPYAAAPTQAKAVPAIGVREAHALLRSGALLVDVREPAELKQSGWLKGAINRPMSSFGTQARDFPLDRPIVLYCRSGRRSTVAGDILTAMGFTRVYNLGGFAAAARAGWPIGGQ